MAMAANPTAPGMVIPNVFKSRAEKATEKSKTDTTKEQNKFLKSISESTSSTKATVESILKGITGQFTADQKNPAKKELEKNSGKFFDKQKKLLTPADINKQKRWLKIRHKFLVVGKFFTTVMKSLKIIADNSFDWIKKLLGLLLFFAIFDPNGEFLMSLLNIMTNLFIWLINVIAANLPRIFKAMIVIGGVIVKALMKAIPLILDAVINMLNTIISDPNAPMAVKVLAQLFKGLATFAKTAVPILLPFLAKFFPFFIGFVLLFKAFYPIVSNLIKVLGFLKIGIIKLFGAAALGPIAIAAAIAAIIALVYVFREQIVDFFDNIEEMLIKKFGVYGKAIAQGAKLILAPIYWLAKLFINIKKEGISKGFLSTVKQFMEFFSDFRKSIQDVFKAVGDKFPALKQIFAFLAPAVDMILKVFGHLIEYISAYVSAIIDFVKDLKNGMGVGEALGKMFTKIWGAFINFLSNIWNTLKEKGPEILSNFFAWIFGTVIPKLFEWLLEGLIWIITTAIPFILKWTLKGLWWIISTAIPTLIQWILRAIWWTMVEGIPLLVKGIAKAIWKVLAKPRKWLADQFSKFFTGILNTGKSLLASVRSAITSSPLYTAIVGGMGDAINKIRDKFSWLTNWLGQVMSELFLWIRQQASFFSSTGELSKKLSERGMNIERQVKLARIGESRKFGLSEERALELASKFVSGERVTGKNEGEKKYLALLDLLKKHGGTGRLSTANVKGMEELIKALEDSSVTTEELGNILKGLTGNSTATAPVMTQFRSVLDVR